MLLDSHGIGFSTQVGRPVFILKGWRKLAGGERSVTTGIELS